MRLEQYRWIQGWHINAFGTLFGGTLLSFIDEDTNMLCYNNSEPESHYTTAGYDRLSFLKPVRVRARLHFIYDIVHVGNKSVTILTKIYNLDENALVFTGYTTMVRIAGSGLKQEIKDAIPKNTPVWEQIEKLREDRKKGPF